MSENEHRKHRKVLVDSKALTSDDFKKYKNILSDQEHTNETIKTPEPSAYDDDEIIGSMPTFDPNDVPTLDPEGSNRKNTPKYSADTAPHKQEHKSKRGPKIVVGIALAICAALIVSQLSFGQTMVVRADTVHVELGKPVVLSKSKLLNTDEMKGKDVKNTKVSSKLMTDSKHYTYDPKSKTVVSNGHPYLLSGHYTVQLTEAKDTQKVNIIVEDTKKPVFQIAPSEIFIEQDAEDVDLSRYFLVTDKSKVSLSFSKYSLKKTGKQTVKVSAKDKAGNKAKKSIVIHILSEEDLKKGKKLTPMLDETVPLSASTYQKVMNGDMTVQMLDISEKTKELFQKGKSVNGYTSFNYQYKSDSDKRLSIKEIEDKRKEMAKKDTTSEDKKDNSSDSDTADDSASSSSDEQTKNQNSQSSSNTSADTGHSVFDDYPNGFAGMTPEAAKAQDRYMVELARQNGGIFDNGESSAALALDYNQAVAYGEQQAASGRCSSYSISSRVDYNGVTEYHIYFNE
ncbi:hypothetical protein [Catenisphaera adipataccumulans]|uniref:Uncharacterized protein n=1 Tax=Catenisphaera adipataccumulans TaxID=700500 RepID=A0A7W8CVN9_9FIRM|nr:hypothetical protein [Catenisphaera adipataccumulans]MBB5182472.1 hypothetical protein [Catenisphaera adipataccumulans]